jgi:putative Mg2+ transporter-C (MgtC) family protein
MPIHVLLIRLLTATILGGLIGMERESKKRAAGFRTHVLVSVGSALVMVSSEYIFSQYKGLTNLDPGRLGAQVISGIGFLGAGTIIREGANVKGLTTAASLWVVSCVGLAAGMGFYEAAILSTGIIYLTLVLLRKFENVVYKSENTIEFSLKITDNPAQLGEVELLIKKVGANITNVEFVSEGKDEMYLKFFLKLSKRQSKETVLRDIMNLSGVNIHSAGE